MQRHSRWIYFLPIVHLLACVVGFVGLAVPLLQGVGIVFTIILLADFPISLLAYALAWRHGVLAAIWIVGAGTLWWYLLSVAGEALLSRFPRRHSLKCC